MTFRLKIREWVDLFFHDVYDYFAALHDAVRLHFAIKLADAKQRAYNKRYFVMPDYLNKLTVINNNDIKWLKRAHLMRKQVSHLEIMRDCLYYTPLSRNDESSRMTIEERMQRKAKWLSYMERVRSRYYQNKLNKIHQRHARKK
jgi:hypothetical protein